MKTRLLEESKKELQDLLSNPSSEKLIEVASNATTTQLLVTKYISFIENVHQGKLGKTVTFWLMYMV